MTAALLDLASSEPSLRSLLTAPVLLETFRIPASAWEWRWQAERHWKGQYQPPWGLDVNARERLPLVKCLNECRDKDRGENHLPR